MKNPITSTLSTTFYRRKKFNNWRADVAQAGVQATWTALGLQTGIDPHRGSVGRKFRLLGRTAIVIDSGAHYLSPLQLLAYVVLGSLHTRGLNAAEWNTLHDRAYRTGLTDHAPEGAPLCLPPPPLQRPTPTALNNAQLTRIPPDQMRAFWQRRASPIAPPAAVARPLCDLASTRRFKTAALYALAESDEIAFFSPESLRGMTPLALPPELEQHPTAQKVARRGLPGWLPLTMRWRTHRARIHASLVIPTWSLDGERTNVVARALSTEHTGLKSSRATGVMASGYLYANALGRAVLTGTDTGDIIVTEGEIDWLLWASERPDLAVLGIYSGSITAELGKRLAAATHIGCRVIIRTDRDPAGDRYAAALITSLSQAGADRSRIYRAAHRSDNADDGDLWRDGLLNILDPCEDATLLPELRADLTSREPWANLPTVTLQAMRGETGVLARAFEEGLSRRDGIATGIATSTGSGKSFAAVQKLSMPAQTGVVLLIAPGRVAAVTYRDAFEEAGVTANLFLGRAGSEGTGERLGRPDPRRGIITCENQEVLLRSRRGLDVSASCASCPFAATCEARGGTRGMRQAIATAETGVVILTAQMLPAALACIPAERIAAVTFDENPGPWASTLSQLSIEAIKAHTRTLRRQRLDQRIPDGTPLAHTIDNLINTTALLTTLLEAGLRYANEHASRRCERGADIRLPNDRCALHAAATIWCAHLRDGILSPRHRFPNVAVAAIRLIEAIAADADAVDVVSTVLADGEQGRLTPAHFAWIASMPTLPPEIPVIFLDATPEPEVWQAVTGRSITLIGGRLMRHNNEQAACFHTANHTAKFWSASQRRLAAAELSRELDVLTPQLTTILHARQGAGESRPLVVITGWRNKLNVIERILRPHLEDLGFAVRFIHWYGTDYRGSNEYTGASVIWTLGTPRSNGDQQRLLARTIQRCTDQPVAEVAAETDWSRVATGALAAVTQAAGRARSTIDADQRAVLFVHSGTDTPTFYSELIAAGQGHNHGQLHGNNRTAACLQAIGAGLISQALTDPDLTPGVPSEHRPSRSGIGRAITTLRAAGVQPILVPTTSRRVLSFYPIAGASLEMFENAMDALGIDLLKEPDDHAIPTNAIRIEDVLGNPDLIEIQAEDSPGDGKQDPGWYARVGAFAQYCGRLVEVDGLTEQDACFDDGEGGVWLHAPTSALHRPTAALWASRVGMAVSWCGSPATVRCVHHGAIWLQCGLTVIGVAPEEIDPIRW